VRQTPQLPLDPAPGPSGLVEAVELIEQEDAVPTGRHFRIVTDRGPSRGLLIRLTAGPREKPPQPLRVAEN
jgi:hypothetical protein